MIKWEEIDFDTKKIINKSKEISPLSICYEGYISEEDMEKLEKECDVHCSSIYMNGTAVYNIRYSRDVKKDGNAKEGGSMRNVMISIKPKWCELIESGTKTIEIRKTKPKCDVPFKCYIYETHDKSKKYYDTFHKNTIGKVIGEFICDRIRPIMADSFIVREDAESVLEGSCLSISQFKDYAGWKHGSHIWECKDLYAWHISDLVIYDKPKDITEFKSRQLVWEGNNHIHRYREMERPPQSWCYVEAEG